MGYRLIWIINTIKLGFQLLRCLTLSYNIFMCVLYNFIFHTIYKLCNNIAMENGLRVDDLHIKSYEYWLLSIATFNNITIIMVLIVIVVT